MSEMIGTIDLVAGRNLHGWAADLGDLHRAVTIEVLSGERVVAAVLADIHRKDLELHGLGGGRHAFHCAVPRDPSHVDGGVFHVRIQGSGVLLQHQGTTEIQLDAGIMIEYVAGDITNNCNLRCPFCVVDYSQAAKTQLVSEEDFVALLDLLPGLPEGGFWLSCMHEPTLHPRLSRFLGLIPPAQRKKVCFTTNLARPFPDEELGCWAESGIRHINISLDTLDAGRYARLRKFGHFRVFEDNLNRLARIFSASPAAPKLRYVSTVFRSTAGELAEILRRSNEQWLASANEVRHARYMASQAAEFVASELLGPREWGAVVDGLAASPYLHVTSCPAPDFWEERERSANFFELRPIPAPEPVAAFTEPLRLRFRPDGSLLLAEKQLGFQAHIRELGDPLGYFRRSLAAGRVLPFGSA